MDFEERIAELIRDVVKDEVAKATAPKEAPAKKVGPRAKVKTRKPSPDLRRYTEDEVAAVRFLYIDRGLTQREIAEIVGRSPGAIGQRLSNSGIRKGKEVAVRADHDDRPQLKKFNPAYLAQYRKDLGFTQLQLSKAVFMAESHIRAMELGRMTPYVDVAEKLADVLKVNVSDFTD